MLMFVLALLFMTAGLFAIGTIETSLRRYGPAFLDVKRALREGGGAGQVQVSMRPGGNAPRAGSSRPLRNPARPGPAPARAAA
jgi:hypothetical protein